MKQRTEQSSFERIRASKFSRLNAHVCAYTAGYRSDGRNCRGAAAGDNHIVLHCASHKLVSAHASVCFAIATGMLQALLVCNRFQPSSAFMSAACICSSCYGCMKYTLFLLVPSAAIQSHHAGSGHPFSRAHANTSLE